MPRKVKIQSCLTGKFLNIGPNLSSESWSVSMKEAAQSLDSERVWTVDDDIRTAWASQIQIITQSKAAYLGINETTKININGEKADICFSHTETYYYPMLFTFKYRSTILGAETYQIKTRSDIVFKILTDEENSDILYAIEDNSPLKTPELNELFYIY